MENDNTIDELTRRMEEMQEEIASLRAQLHEKETAPGKLPDMAHIKSMFEEGFGKLSDALRPLADETERRVGEKIAVHPFTAVMVALGAGLVIGKLVDAALRNPYRAPETKE